MSETTPVGSVSLPMAEMGDWDADRLIALGARQGLPIPFVDARIRSENGELPWDGKSAGELEFRGPWIARRYFRESEVEGKWTDDGWLRSGDVATIDPEGYVSIVDRFKDLVKSGGEWISSVALENELVDHPAVREAAVIAVPHPKWGERPMAFVVLRPGASVSEEEVKAHLEKRYPKWWLPDQVRFVSELPKTSAGKISKLTLREREAKARSEGPPSAP